MKYIYPLILLATPVSAVSTFTGSGDFNDAGSWDNGLPRNANGPGEIASGATATMSANYLMANDGSSSVTDITVNGMLNTGANELQLRNNSTLAFDIAGDGTHFTLVGNSLQVRIGSTPNLLVDFADAPTTGATFDLITGVSGFTDFQGNGTGFTFDPSNVTVNGLGAGQSYQLNYGGSLQLEIVPESASAALLGLGGPCAVGNRPAIPRCLYGILQASRQLLV